MEAIVINPQETCEDIQDLAMDVIPEWVFSKLSSIQGMGAFARQNITQGKKLFWNVPIMRHDEYRLLTNQLSAKEKEFFLTTEEAVYDIRNSILRYMNHSHRPNIDWGDGYITALTDIQLGEELTIDYGWDCYEWETSNTKVP